MSTDVMLLVIMCGMTLIAYMIAINAHGPVRLSLSYLLATFLLAANVWAIVQHVNIGLDTIKAEELRRLEAEKRQIEERVLSQEEALRANKDRMGFAAKLNAVITSGTGHGNVMRNADLQDRNANLETLLARAIDVKKKVAALKNEFEQLSTTDNFFAEPFTLIKDGIQLLTEAAQYYHQYYYADDSDQEALRERIMRQKAANANEKFQKASVLIASSG
jgi:molybdenum cofactor biosynthesis enzyme MoaA